MPIWKYEVSAKLETKNSTYATNGNVKYFLYLEKFILKTMFW